MIIACLQSEGKSLNIQILLKIFKSKKKKILVNVLKVDNVFHNVEHPATTA